MQNRQLSQERQLHSVAAQTFITPPGTFIQGIRPSCAAMCEKRREFMSRCAICTVRVCSVPRNRELCFSDSAAAAESVVRPAFVRSGPATVDAPAPSTFLFRLREIRPEMATNEFAEIELSNIRISKYNRGDNAYGHGNGTSTYLPVNYVVENPGLRPTTHRHRHFPSGGKPQRIRSSGAGKAMPSDCPRKSRILRGPSAPHVPAVTMPQIFSTAAPQRHTFIQKWHSGRWWSEPLRQALQARV